MIINFEKDNKMFEDMAKCRYKCKCGHSVTITNKLDKTICSWCGNLVFKTPKAEFEYRVNQMRKKFKNF